MSERSQLLDAALRDLFAPVLRTDGFKGSGRNYRRVRGELIHVVNVQGSWSQPRFYVNFGVHLAFLPDVIGNPVSPKTITEPSCELRRRMTIAEADMSWDHREDNQSIVDAVAAAVSVYQRVGRSQIDFFSSFPESFDVISADALRDGTANLGGFGTTPQLLAWLFARIRRHQQRLTEAREFAELGLKNIGQAFILKLKIEEFLREIEREIGH